jgi:hypothetical protein
LLIEPPASRPRIKPKTIPPISTGGAREIGAREIGARAEGSSSSGTNHALLPRDGNGSFDGCAAV